MRHILLSVAVAGLIGTFMGPGEASAAYRRTGAGGGPVTRYFATRLYYSNAFRGLIPSTGYGGFRRPAFGYRGY